MLNGVLGNSAGSKHSCWGPHSKACKLRCEQPPLPAVSQIENHNLTSAGSSDWSGVAANGGPNQACAYSGKTWMLTDLMQMRGALGAVWHVCSSKQSSWAMRGTLPFVCLARGCCPCLCTTCCRNSQNAVSVPTTGQLSSSLRNCLDLGGE